MIEIAIDQVSSDRVLIRWDATGPYLVVHPDGSTSEQARPAGIVVWDSEASRDLDEVINDAYARGYSAGQHSPVAERPAVVEAAAQVELPSPVRDAA